MSYRNAFVVAELVQQKLMDVLQVKYDAAKEGVKNPLPIALGKVIADFTEQEKMNSVPKRNIETLLQSEKFMEEYRE